MPVQARIVLTRLLLVTALLFLTQCADAGRFKPLSKTDRVASKVDKDSASKPTGEDRASTDGKPKEKQSKKDQRKEAKAKKAQEAQAKKEREAQAKKEKEVQAKKDEEAKVDYRVVAVDQTPFYRWMRKGLRGDSKPSRFLNAGTKVEVLQENEEEKFSQIRLPDRKKGWVPSRLVREKAADDAVTPYPESDIEKLAPATSMSVPDETHEIPAATPAQLPGAEDNLPPINIGELPPPIMPETGIIAPKTKPLPKGITPKVEADIILSPEKAPSEDKSN
ncbi:MAG: hypothetical protein ACI8T1_002205 [Verrucomicrobiales bacterium]|jgi:hypothetical protein